MSLEGLAPELVWGLIPRFVGVLYVVGFVPLIPQHAVMPGAASYFPLPPVYARLRRDFPGIRRFFEWPSILWLNSSDAMVRAIPFVGALCGTYAIYGGPYAWYALLVAWMLWLSLESRGLLFPWDFGVEPLLRLERLLGRYAWLLRQRTESHRFAQTEPSLPVMSNFRYEMLLQEIVLDGREACAAVMAEPAQAAARAERSTDATQIWAVCLLRYDQVMAHVATFRGSEMGLQSYEEELPGFFEYYELLVQIVPPGEEFCPRFVKHPDGEHTIPGFYPPPPLLGDGVHSGGDLPA